MPALHAGPTKPCSCGGLRVRRGTDRRWICVSCVSSSDRARRIRDQRPRAEALRRWKAKNPNAVLQSRIKQYGISADEYFSLLLSQGGVCAICKGPPSGGKRYSVDHDHASLAVRGLLCGKCNIGLGMFADDPVVLQKAIEYLGRSR